MSLNARLKLCAAALLAVAACLCAATGRGGARVSERAGTAAGGVYSDDARDPWNRIFRCLFTRRVRARLSEEFAEGAPFGPRSKYMPYLRPSRRVFERAEEGDRAVEPLYPNFLSAAGPDAALDEPLFDELRAALTEALAETRTRTPLARALMQSDAWAAFDLLSTAAPLDQRTLTPRKRRQIERRDELLPLLARFVHKLALTPEEIDALPDNFRAAARAGLFPDVFAREWAEVEWHAERSHDDSADFRRAARVFVLPARPPRDPQQFFDGLRNAHERIVEGVGAVALVTQNLLIDTRGRPVPSPLVSEVQFRFFDRGAGAASVRQFELSRRLLLLSADAPGGFLSFDGSAPHYLPAAGNDYRFASPQFGPELSGGSPLVVRLSTRCAACHGAGARVVFTFMSHDARDTRPVRLLDPARPDRALRAARAKAAREDFKELLRHSRVLD